MLVSSGARANKKIDDTGHLYDAIKAQDAEKVKFLLIGGVKPYVSGIPILLHAVEVGTKDVVQAVLDSGKVSVNSGMSDARTYFGIGGKGWSALHVAVARGNEEIVKILLKAGADKDCKYEFWCEWDRTSEWAFLTPRAMSTLSRNHGLETLLY